MSKEVKILVVARINPDELGSLNVYLEGLSNAYTKVGAQTEVHYPIEKIYLGKDKPDFISVISFQDEEAFQAVYASGEYQGLVPLRDKAFHHIEVFFVKI